jgi:hypothetical protein
MPITLRIQLDALFVKRDVMGSNVKRETSESGTRYASRATLHVYEAISPI